MLFENGTKFSLNYFRNRIEIEKFLSTICSRYVKFQLLIAFFSGQFF